MDVDGGLTCPSRWWWWCWRSLDTRGYPQYRGYGYGIATVVTLPSSLSPPLLSLSPPPFVVIAAAVVNGGGLGGGDSPRFTRWCGMTWQHRVVCDVAFVIGCGNGQGHGHLW
jgi:hypothetical protein